ncbi:MAG: spermidine/putrescine ABC transporter permease PotC, partial [Nostocaceae cyanobacterium]|nr:spermidine/putrescine ABC transporter permease PotC [Nostocaceae cyanobacterium]
MNISQKKPQVAWQAVFTLVMFLVMYLPILVLAFYSFNQSEYSASWEGFTLDWYSKLFKDDRLISALKNSLIVACSAVGISAVLGTLMAVGLARYRFPGKFLYQGVA